MYTLSWRRNAGKLHPELLLHARDLMTGFRGISNRSDTLTKLLSSTRSSCARTNPSRQKVVDQALPVRVNGRFASDWNPGQGKFSTLGFRYKGTRYLHQQVYGFVPRTFSHGFASRSYISVVLLCKYASRENYTGNTNLFRPPVSFLRYLSGEDRDGDTNRQQTTSPFPDGEGGDKDSEEEHNSSINDGVERGSLHSGERGLGRNSRMLETASGLDDKGEPRQETIGLSTDESTARDEERESVVVETANLEAVFLAQKALFVKDFESRILEWRSLAVDLPQFPYYLSENTRDSLVDCVAAHLRHPTFAGYGSGLPSSSRRIMLRGPAGTEIYQEKLVEAVARYLQASLLVLDSTTLSPHDYGDQESSSEVDEDYNEESEYGANWNDDKWRENECKEGSDTEDNEDAETDAEVEKPSNDRIFSKMPVLTLLGVSAESPDAIRRKLLEKAGDGRQEEENFESQTDFSIKKGDRVRYIGDSKLSTDSLNRSSYQNEQASTSGRDSTSRQVLKAGQRGRIVVVPKHMTGKVGVKFENAERQLDDVAKDEKDSEDTQKEHNLIEWCDLSDLELDDGPVTTHNEWLAAIDALSEVASSPRPLIVYLPDPKRWFDRAVPVEQRQDFLMHLEHKLDLSEVPVVFIAGRTDEEESEIDDRERLKAHLDYIRQRLNLKAPAKYFKLKELLGGGDIYDIFVNAVNIVPPQEEEALVSWNAQIDSHKEISQARSNYRMLQKILELHNMDCPDLDGTDLQGLRLTNSRAENVVGWARNHHLGSCSSTPPTNNGKLMIPRDSLERALTRLRENDAKKAQPITKDFKTVAEDEYEKALLSAVIPPNEVGVKFDHIGSLENVKQALRELVMLPLQRPELFAKGNLTRPCKGVLLFGPPGTGKTLLAKAVATEAGANFINITGSTITSKWFGDAEKLTKALFSLAKKLSPAVIFVDEVDSLLGARGGSSEHEATRKTRNEFMAAWDGLRSKDNERVLVLAATNRPFDLDDAVIRRLPRRILVDLPNAENREKILRVILVEEDLEQSFDFKELARLTEGYSGSDLKNLSIAAAYRPIRELLDAEQREQTELRASEREGGRPMLSRSASSATIRELRLSDFREAMSQVGASVAYDAVSMNELRRWNEQYGEGGNRRKSTFGFAV
ncbi:hypothetical protein R1sor_004302 [Riccia sorocarpa]|uniref:AAA+ ATPase domain-containing protein n=1 Tax=Riccia sorocarpa TaxID=122646 RepID=A0ABD3HIH1_9MARC